MDGRAKGRRVMPWTDATGKGKYRIEWCVDCGIRGGTPRQDEDTLCEFCEKARVEAHADSIEKGEE